MANRPKMSREDRAKQFMPFAALKGYPEALRKKEKIVVPKVEFSEEYAEILDRKLRQIRKNDIITVIYFYNKALNVSCNLLNAMLKVMLSKVHLTSHSRMSGSR